MVYKYEFKHTLKHARFDGYIINYKQNRKNTPSKIKSAIAVLAAIIR